MIARPLFPSRWFRHSLILVTLAGGVVITSAQHVASPPARQHTTANERLEAELVQLLEKQQFDRAIALAKQLTAAREEGGKPDARLAEALVWLAEAEAGAGHSAEAASAYQRAVDAAATALGPMHADVAVYLNERGVFQFVQGDYSAAVPVFERALRIREKAFGSDALETAEIVNNLAQVRQESGDYAAAQPLLERALAIYEKIQGADHGDVAIALNNLAGLYRLKGDYLRAEPLYRRALAIVEKTEGPESLMAARLLNNLGLMLRDRGSLDEARPLLDRSVTIRERNLGESHPDVARALNNVGVVLFESGHVQPAEALYRRALTVAEGALGDRHPLVAQIVNNLAVTELLQGRYDAAEPLFARAVRMRREVLGNLHPETGVALASQAVLFDLTNRRSEAVRAQLEATEIGEHNLALTLATGSEAQKLRYVTMASFAEETDITISLQQRPRVKDADATRLALTTVLRRKGRVLDAMSRSLQIVRSQLTGDEQPLLDNLARLRTDQARMVLRGPGSQTLAAFEMKLRRLEEEAQRIEALVSQKSQAFRAQHQAVSLSEVQKALPAGAVLIEFVQYRPFDPTIARREAKFGPPRYAAFVLEERGEPLSFDLGESSAIDALVDTWRRALRNPQDSTVRRRGREAYRRLFGMMPKEVATAHHLYLAPDAALNLAPFGALVDGSGQYLVERQTISYLTSGRDLLRHGIVSPSRVGPWILADPEFDEAGGGPAGDTELAAADASRAVDLSRAKFKRLPGTGGEAAAIAELLSDARVLTGRAATESAVKGLHGPRILHVATHGFFLDGQDRPALSEGRLLVQETSSASAGTPIENPLLRSGLALAGANRRDGGNGEDGILTALETTAVDLWGTKLAVLSACETGVGEPRRGDGVYGLRRALVMAGSESQLISLWQVSDLATRDLMTSYYRELGGGAGRAEALREVQRAMLRQPKRRHPYYWASFILSGADGPI